MSLHLFWDPIKGSCQVSVHREGANNSCMDSVNDLLDHNSFWEG